MSCTANKTIMAGALVLIGVGIGASAAAQPTLAPPPPMRPNPATEKAIAEASQSAPYPTFGQIPPLPTDVRSMHAWKTSVVTLRSDGARMADLAAAGPWTLGDTEGWAERERAVAAAPAPLTQPSSEADTEAFAAAMRARAIPPPRKR
jgi:hypothetical protein